MTKDKSNQSNKSGQSDIYDIIIVGAGFAGYTAAIYAKRYNLKTLIIAQEPGGAINKANEVENYPGFIKIHGMELMQKFQEHARAFKIEEELDEVIDVKKKDDNFKVTTREEKVFLGKTIILALGSKRRKLNIPGEDKFEGNGVHFCATCDAPFYRGKTTAVIGGSNSAASAALLVSRFAKKVYIIYRGEELRAEPIMIEQIKNTANIEIIYKTNVKEFKGDKFVNKIILDNKFKESEELTLDGVFVEAGSVPSSAIAKRLGIELNDKGEIIVDNQCKTNVEKVYAAGDVTNSVLRQGIVAASQGAIAATSAYQFLTGKKMGSGW